MTSRRRDTPLRGRAVAVSWRRSPEWRYGPGRDASAREHRQQPGQDKTYSERSVKQQLIYRQHIRPCYEQPATSKHPDPVERGNRKHIPSWTISCGGGAVSKEGTDYVESREHHQARGQDKEGGQNSPTERASCCSQKRTTWLRVLALHKQGQRWSVLFATVMDATRWLGVAGCRGPTGA
jgi:hypothetical protein